MAVNYNNLLFKIGPTITILIFHQLSLLFHHTVNTAFGLVTTVTETVKAWRGRVAPGLSGLPGEVLQAGSGQLVIACGQGALALLSLQRPGARRGDTAQVLPALGLSVGRVLPSTA